MHGNFDRATATGWEARRFHYVERLKPLAEYLKRPPTATQAREAGARAVKRMLDRMIRNQEERDGAG